MKFVAIVLLVSIGMVSIVVNLEEPVRFASAESKTLLGKTVYNEIRFDPGTRYDTWWMQQSHHGEEAPEGEWDSLAIVVDRKDASAKFYQLRSGESRDLSQTVPYSVPCYLCHPNGPRAIRPDEEVKPLGFLRRAQVTLLNLRIKSYGVVKSLPRALKEKESLKSRGRFRFSASSAKAPLKHAACVSCHRDAGLFARGQLTRQNALTAKHMIATGAMPPAWFSISAKERQELQDFFDAP